MAHLNTFENLDDLLDGAVLENLCTAMNCSTCGAFFFRQKIANYLVYKLRVAPSRVSGNTGEHKLSPTQVKVLAEELRTVTSPFGPMPFPDT